MNSVLRRTIVSAGNNIVQSRRIPGQALLYSTMKALVYKDVGKIGLEERPQPTISAPSDAIVRMTKSTICGTDLHIWHGHVPTCKPGTVLGHEGVGVIEETGSAVKGFKKGDRVLVSCICSCSTCENCRKGMNSHCHTGGWVLGNTIDGVQAEYARIPHADSSLYALPANVDEAAMVMLSDALPTGFECGVLNGKVQPGSTVAIIGAGPVGLAVCFTAQLYSPSTTIVIDLDPNRLQVSTSYGATHTASPANAKELIDSLTDGKGCDTVIEAVGIPSTFELAQNLLAPGGTLANVGVHGTKVDLHMEHLWDRNIAITTRLVDATSTPMLLNLVKAGKLDAAKIITHRFNFSEMEKAYEVFGQAPKHNALKLLIDMEK